MSDENREGYESIGKLKGFGPDPEEQENAEFAPYEQEILDAMNSDGGRLAKVGHVADYGEHVRVGNPSEGGFIFFLGEPQSAVTAKKYRKAFQRLIDRSEVVLSHGDYYKINNAKQRTRSPGTPE